MPFGGVGGTEVATLRIANAAKTIGVHSLVLCLDPSPVVRAYFEDAGVDVVECAERPEPSIRRGISYYRQSKAVARELRRRGVTVLHGADVAAGFHCGLAGRLAGVPVLCHVRSRHDQVTRRDQRFLRFVNHFVFVSLDSWKRFSYRVPKARGSVLYDGIAPPQPTRNPAEFRAELCAEMKIPQNAVLIGMTARVSPQKDYETLIEAAKIVVGKHSEAFFIIAGDNSTHPVYREHYAHLLALLSEAGLETHFRFLGFRSDVADLLHAFDIFVLSTHLEGLPLAVLEAMACRKPVTATAIDGVPELIDHGRSGFLVPHGDAAPLARHLCELIESPALAFEIGTAAAERVRENFSEAAFEEHVNRLYRRFGRPLSMSANSVDGTATTPC